MAQVTAKEAADTEANSDSDDEHPRETASIDYHTMRPCSMRKHKRSRVA